MDSSKKTARLVGALILIGIVASIAGGTMIGSALDAAGDLRTLSINSTPVVLGVLLELITGLCVVGIAVMLFPVLKKQNEGLALGYVALRTIEAVIIMAAVVSPLALVGISRGYAVAGAPDTAAHHLVGLAFVEVRKLLVGQFTGTFFCLAAYLLFYLLYRSKLVPRFISVWGLIAVTLVLAWNWLELFGVHVPPGMVLALPMILNEVFLAIWLIVKGFDPDALASLPG